MFGRYFGPRPLIEDNSVQVEVDHAVQRAGDVRRHARSCRLRLDVFNLFDADADDITYYYTSRLPGEPAAGVNDIHFHPVESRTLRLAMIYTF